MFNKIETQGYYIIAEIGVNYYDIARVKNISLMEAAKLMIDEAIKAGVDAVKFQSYKAEKLASKFSPSYWDTNEEPTTSQFELFQKFDNFGEVEYQELASYCESRSTIFLSTPFDFDSADYLESMMPMYKISSSDITNIPFIKHISSKRKPVLISTGASNVEEIQNAVKTIEEFVSDVVVLHCVLEYPTPYEHANLAMIESLKELYPNKIIGYSDHTRPDECMDVIKTAWLLGAQVIEKHFTLDKTLTGNDHYHAMDPTDLRKIKEGLEFAKKIKGAKLVECLESESKARLNARRSIVASRNITQGTVITEDMITFKRPGHGISPAEYANVLGKKAMVNIGEDELLTYEKIS